MGARRRAREIGLQLAFQLEDHLDSEPPDQKAIEHAINAFFESFEAPIRAQEYAEQIARGFLRHRREIDELISRHSPRWKLERMARVDRNVLRLCLYEALYENVPHKVAIDEGIELAKRFGTEQSGAFVNGVLDSALKESRSPDEKSS